PAGSFFRSTRPFIRSSFPTMHARSAFDSTTIAGRRFRDVLSNAAPEDDAVFVEGRREIALQIVPDERRTLGVRNAVDIGIRAGEPNQRRANVRVAFDRLNDVALRLDALVVCRFNVTKRTVAPEKRVKQ